MNDGNGLPPDPPRQPAALEPASTAPGVVARHGGEAGDAPRRRAARLLGLGAIAAVALLVGFGAWGHLQRRADAVEFLADQRAAIPSVRTSVVRTLDAPRSLDLPATMQAFNSATLFARATGYIATRSVDIGSRVETGDVLATIAAPDLDQQLAQARAQLTQTQAALAQARAALLQAQANQDLATVTNRRYSKLAAQGYAAEQDGDNARLTLAARNADVATAKAAVDVADANVTAQSAAVSRLEQLASFERVTAPFAGVITARQIEVGDLVTADAASGTPMFSIARTNLLRVQVYVPQDAVFGLKDGDTAQVRVPEMPGRIFHGVVARNATALQSGTRTLLTEIDVDNSDGALAAGLYSIVQLSISRPQPLITLPSTAVIFDKSGLSAAVYEDGIARLRHLDVAEDNGAEVIVRAGLKPGDRVILNPPVDLTDDMRVAATDTGQEIAGRPEAAASTGSSTVK